MRSFFLGLLVLLGVFLGVVWGDTKHYALVVTEEEIYPDCTPRLSLVVNGTFPGPAIYATAGDHIFIRVYNAGSDNMTMHWHGISQYGSPFADGTPYASQWPIPPGKYYDYEFRFDDDIDGTFWYHSHVGTQSLTCHGALIVAAKCANPADCPCTHVNCGRPGDQVWDPIAGDWSPTIGIDVTVNVEIDWNGGSVSVSDSTHVSIEYGNGNGNGNGKNGGPGSSNTGSYISGVEVGSSNGGSQAGGSNSGSQGGSNFGSQGGSNSGYQGGSSSGSQGGSSGSVVDYSSPGSQIASQQGSSQGHKACCNCGCKAPYKKKSRKGKKRGLKKRDSAVSNPPYAFDTSCSKCPIPYDEERIVILEDMFNDRDSTLSTEALNGQFIGGAQNLLMNGRQFATCNQSVIDALGYGETCSTGCSYANIEIEPGKTYLFRIIGATIDSFVGWSIAGHKLQIVQVDGGSWIQPYEADYVIVHAGQRYAVIVEGKSEDELAAYGKDYYYIQMEDFQNPPPPSGSFGPPSGNQTRGGNGTLPGGSPPGFVGGTTSQSQPQGTSNSNPPGGPNTNDLANFDPNNFAAQHTDTTDPSSSSNGDFDTQTYQPNNFQAPSPTTSSGDFHNDGHGPSFGDPTSQQDTSSATETSTTSTSPYVKKKKMRRQGGPPPGAGGPGGPPGGGPPGAGPPGGGGGPPTAPTAAFGLLTYKTSSGSVPSDSSIFITPPNNLTDTMPILPNSTIGSAYQNITNQFRPYYSNPAPQPNKRIILNNTAQSFGGKERDTLNSLGFYPTQPQTPLLVGMYNGQIDVDDAAESLAAAQGNYFNDQVGAFLLEVDDVVEIVIQNQVGLNGVVIHPFHMHGGDFWDMGGGSGEFSEEAYEELLATVDPIRRDTTLLSGLPSTRGSNGNPQGFRVWRWQASSRGVWMLHCHIIGHMLLGLQTMVVVGKSDQLPALPPAYQGAYLSPGQAGAMGNVNNDTKFIPYFISNSSTDPTWENARKH